MLQKQTQSYFIEQNIICYKISFDAMRMIEALASEKVRALWNEQYKSMSLSKLFENWNNERESASNQ